MAPKDRHFLGQHDSWQKGLSWTKVSLGKFSWPNIPLGRESSGANILWVIVEYDLFLEVSKNKNEKCKKNVSIIIDFLQNFHRFLVR